MTPDMWYFLSYRLGSLVQDSLHPHVVLVFVALNVASSGAKFGFVVGRSQSSAFVFVGNLRFSVRRLKLPNFPVDNSPILEQCPRVEVVAVLFSSE